MDNVLALLLAGGQVEELLCLTEKRAKAALPVFGIYRIIDFALSNLMHTGIENVGVLSQYRPHDLVRHIDTGEHWDFIGRKRAIRILPPYRGLKGSDWYKGTADAVFQNLHYIEEFNIEHLLILAADHVYCMNYQPFIDFHIKNDFDATVCFTPLQSKSTRFGYGVIHEKKLVGYLEKPDTAPSDFVSMTLYVFKKNFLIDVLRANAQQESHEFGRDILPEIISNNNIGAYVYKDFWAYARTISSYYDTNMDYLKSKIDLEKWPIRTNLSERSKYRDRTPALINGAIINSAISDECKIEGNVYNSILSPGVVVEKGAEVKDSIIFHDTTIRQNAVLHKVICDKDVEVREGTKIGLNGMNTPSREYGSLLSSGITVIGRKITIPEKTTIGANTVIFPGTKTIDKTLDPGSTLS